MNKDRLLLLAEVKDSLVTAKHQLTSASIHCNTLRVKALSISHALVHVDDALEEIWKEIGRS